jgi:hypothetical protein
MAALIHGCGMRSPVRAFRERLLNECLSLRKA